MNRGELLFAVLVGPGVQAIIGMLGLLFDENLVYYHNLLESHGHAERTYAFFVESMCVYLRQYGYIN